MRYRKPEKKKKKPKNLSIKIYGRNGDNDDSNSTNFCGF